MGKVSRRLNSLVSAILCLLITLPAIGQTAMPVDSRTAPEVVLEAKVLGLPAATFNQFGFVIPESAPLSESPVGFAVILPDADVQSLLSDSRTVSIHGIKLQRSSGTPMRFRVDSRVMADPSVTTENAPYFEVGMTFEVTTKALPNRNIGVSSASVVQVRKGPAPENSLAPIIFETSPIKHDIQIPQGKTILLGGFLTSQNSAGLPNIPAVEGNPVLSYVSPKSGRKGNEPEIVVLLTPKLVGSAIEPETPPITKIDASVQAIPVADAAPKSESPTLAASVVPPAAKVVTAPVIPLKPDARFYTVQVGAFGSEANAESLALELKPKFSSVFIDKASTGNTPYRVRVGRLSDLAAARRIQSQLTSQGFDAFVVTPGQP